MRLGTRFLILGFPVPLVPGPTPLSSGDVVHTDPLLPLRRSPHLMDFPVALSAAHRVAVQPVLQLSPIPIRC